MIPGRIVFALMLFQDEVEFGSKLSSTDLSYLAMLVLIFLFGHHVLPSGFP